MPQNDKISAIILAGGKSLRMGEDKKMIQINKTGLRLWEHMVSLIEPFVKEILIIANPDELHHTKHIIIKDIIPGLGPLGGIYTGLKNINTSQSLVLPIDMPLLNRQTLERLLKSCDENEKIIIARHGQYIEPLVGIYPKSSLPMIEKMIKDQKYKLRLLFDLFPTCFVDFENDIPFMNLNTPEDLKKILSYLNSQK